jgi:two-component system phosphate regulon response regulator PhoB
MADMRMLVVEDDRLLAEGLVSVLTRAGHAVDHAASGKYADALLARTAYDLIVLDIGLPDIDGFEVLRRLRARHAPTSVLVLTARDAIEDRVHGLDLGADDYLTKPFSMTELLARLRAVMRRIRPSLAEDVVSIGDIEMDRAAHRVRRAGTEVHLGPTEYKLLDHLIQHPGRVFSREQLLDAVWGSDVYVEARTVDVHVGRLRKALNIDGVKDPIRTVRSAGYSLDDTLGAG